MSEVPEEAVERKVKESFFAIRRVDGELIGEYAWVGVGGPHDWQPAEDEEDWLEFGTEYEMVRMHVEHIETRTFGDALRLHERVSSDHGALCDYCGEVWPCEFVRDHTALSAVPERGEK